MMIDHIGDERPPRWWETTLMLRNRLDDERPPWCWETTLIMKRDHLDVERPAWWPPWWWETTLMRGHPSFNSLLPYPITLGYIIGRWSTFGTVLFKLVMETCCRIMFGSRSAWWQIHCLTHNKKQTNKKPKTVGALGAATSAAS